MLEDAKIELSIQDDNDISFSKSDLELIYDYNALSNKPKINDIELVGDKKSNDLHLQDEMSAISDTDIDKIIYGM